MKPPRPTISFPTYPTESSRTVVDDQPWFMEEAPLGRAQGITPPPPSSEVQSVRTMVAVAPPALPSHAHSPGGLPAPAWSLPALPVVMIPIVERKELPSFGPVALDVIPYSEAWDREARTVRVTRTRRPPFLAFAAAAAIVLAGIASGRALIPSEEIAPASVHANSSSFALQPESQPPAHEASMQGPLAVPVPAPVVDLDAARPLTPEELFPKNSAIRAPLPAAGEKVTPAQYRVQKARLASDLAHRNAPVAPLASKPSLQRLRARAPSVDDLLRAAPLRGERD